jgi:hypothetical protein
MQKESLATHNVYSEPQSGLATCNRWMVWEKRLPYTMNLNLSASLLSHFEVFEPFSDGLGDGSPSKLLI